MHIHNFLFCVVFSLFNPVFSDENYVEFRGCCTFKGPRFEDPEFIIENRYDNKLMMQYNSTRGNWTGFTAYSIEEVKKFNRNPYDALQRQFEREKLCTDNIGYIQQTGNLTSVPIIKLNSVKHPPMLVCSAYNFYPKQIKVTWLRNGQEVTSAVSFSEVLPDGEWCYQIHSYLEHTPTAGETVTCMVEHLSLSAPVLHVWDTSLPAPERFKIAVGLCGLILGFVAVSSGFIYYKKKSAAYFTLYRGRVSIPVEHLPAAEATQQSEQTSIADT